MFKEKRGLSEVVTVSLIILLSIAAVVIVWTFVRSTLEDVGQQITGACVTTSAALVGTCNLLTGAVTVRNDGRQDIIDALKLVYYETNAIDSVSETRDADCTIISPLAQKVCTPQDPDGAGAQTAVPDFNGAGAGGAPARVGVAPIVQGNTCPISSQTAACS